MLLRLLLDINFVSVVSQEKAALKKLENVKKDHLKRLEELEVEQATDAHKAQLIEINLALVRFSLHTSVCHYSIKNTIQKTLCTAANI